MTQSYWAAEQDAVDVKVPMDLRRQLLRQHGDFSLAYSTVVQPRMEYFGDEHGCVSFRRRWGITFVLGDVLAAPDRTANLIDAFLQQHPHSVFCQSSQALAEHLAQRNFFVNQMGVDTTIDLPNYDFAGKSKEWLRYAANWCRRREYRICEVSFDQIPPAQVESVSEAWRKTRTIKQKEVRFLNRPIVLDDEPDVRKFFFFSPASQLQAFIYLDPLYRNGQLTGFVTAIKRRLPDAPVYSEQALMKHIIETLKSEGHQQLKLGLSPLAFIDDDRFRSSRTTGRVFRMAFNSKLINRYFYHLNGHANYKRRFRADEEKVYFCSNRRFSAQRLMALVGLCGIA